MEGSFKNSVFRKWEGREICTSVLGFEMLMSLEDEYFKGLLEYLMKWKEDILNKKLEGTEDSEHGRKYYEKLRGQLDGAKPKITVKIELEKYE